MSVRSCYFCTDNMKYTLIHLLSRLRLLIAVFLFGIGALSILQAQVQATVTSSPGARQDEKSIHVQWSSQDESKWHEDNDGRLDIMSLKAHIGPEVLQPNQKGTTVFHLTFDQPCRIECLIRVNVIDPAESIYLYDKNTGGLIADLKPSGQSSFLTPPFDPENTEIVWKRIEGDGNKSDITIENIYYDPVHPSDNRAIGFGTALPCHPNAACKTDSLSRLISNSDVRIRLVMQEGIGWCSGSLINTTRKDKTPFLLTAYHCTFNYTPLYDMWRFDFQYKSPDCPNPATEPQYFSLTGCALKASGQASDFLLVLLDNDIPADQEVTFAGWDRDPGKAPDTTYLVHHPNADIRKFSTCTDSAVIHPYQIGWSEGYTTPANHHFRFKFTEGGHEKGSSGGGAYNQDFHLIGQLHGGTSGCEDVNVAYVGRLAKSWDLGPTPPQRLKDWLDPDNTGVTQLEAIENISASDMVDIHGIIKDPLGRPVRNVKIHVSGSTEEDMTTDADGKFQLLHVNRNAQYIFTPEKAANPANGLNVFDLLAIQKHLLAKELFTANWQLIAADATNNGEITVGDILLVLKLILGKIQYFPSSNAWRFDPAQVTLDSLPPGPQNEVQIMGIKIGDVNATSDPSQ
jgi:hypothetical protein